MIVLFLIGTLLNVALCANTQSPKARESSRRQSAGFMQEVKTSSRTITSFAPRTPKPFESATIALFESVVSKNQQGVLNALKKKAKINGLPRRNQIPLFAAIQNDDLYMASLLITKGANVNLPILEYQKSVRVFPLHHAISLGNIQMARLLIENGAQLDYFLEDNSEQQQQTLPLIHYVAISGSPEMLFFIKNECINRDIIFNLDEILRYPDSTYSCTPIIFAGCYGLTRMVKALLDLGANISIPDFHGSSLVTILFDKLKNENENDSMIGDYIQLLGNILMIPNAWNLQDDDGTTLREFAQSRQIDPLSTFGLKMTALQIAFPNLPVKFMFASESRSRIFQR